MVKKIVFPRKARRCKNMPFFEEKENVEKSPKKDAPVFENEQEALAVGSDSENAHHVEDEGEVGDEGKCEEKHEDNGEEVADEKEEKVETEEKAAVLKPSRPRRQLKTAKDVVAKPEEEVKGDLTQQYANLELAEAAKGKRKPVVKFQAKKEENEKEVEDVGVENSSSPEKDEEVVTKAKKHVGATTTAATKVGINKRGRVRKADIPKDAGDASTVDQKGDEKAANKRGVRGTKRGAGENEVEIETKEPDTLSEDISEFRCCDHQYDPETKTLQFKLTRGRKMKLITSEEARKFAMPTCFDYMLQTLTKN